MPATPPSGRCGCCASAGCTGRARGGGGGGERGVHRQAERGAGLAALGLVGTVPEIEALHAALSTCVDALPADPADTRTREQKLLDVLLDLVLWPGENGLPPVQVILTLVASVRTVLGGDEPALLGGSVVSAE